MCEPPEISTDRAEEAVLRLARATARSVDVRAPADALRKLGLELRACASPLNLPGRRVFGAWDPLLRRIELMRCDSSRPDLELARSLGHELGHALLGPERGATGEATADRFADCWIAALGVERVGTLATALRQLADPSVSHV